MSSHQRLTSLFCLFFFGINSALAETDSAWSETVPIIVSNAQISNAAIESSRAYLSAVNRKIKRHWFPPRDGNACSISFVITAHGKLDAKPVFKPSSGIAICDMAALKAIMDSDPLGELPSGISKIKVLMRFDYSNNLTGELFPPLRRSIFVGGGCPE